MRVTVSLFAGRVRPLAESGRASGIVKSPVEFPLALGPNGFAGDEQADRRVHGGPDKAIHVYPAAHYARLAQRFPEIAQRFVPGSIGENISVDRLTEADVRIGDIWQLGSARLQLCQPRSPCWKIDARYGCDGIAKFIADESIAGWYCRVLAAGVVNAGDAFELVEAAKAPTLREALMLLAEHRPATDRLAVMLALPALAEDWRKSMARRLDWLRRNH